MNLLCVSLLRFDWFPTTVSNKQTNSINEVFSLTSSTRTIITLFSLHSRSLPLNYYPMEPFNCVHGLFPITGDQASCMLGKQACAAEHLLQHLDAHGVGMTASAPPITESPSLITHGLRWTGLRSGPRRRPVKVFAVKLRKPFLSILRPDENINNASSPAWETVQDGSRRKAHGSSRTLLFMGGGVIYIWRQSNITGRKENAVVSTWV